MKRKVVITDYVDDPTIEREILGDDIEIVCLNETREDFYPSVISEACALLVWHGHITRQSLSKMKSCETIVRYGTGYETIDVAVAREHGINVCNTPDYGVEEVADTACAMILTCIRQVLYYDNLAREITEKWQTRSAIGLKRTSDHVLGIIGCGRIGTSVAVRMKAFGIKIIIFDPNLPSGYEKAIGVQRVEEIGKLLDQATVISFHTPLSEETNGLVNDAFIDMLNSDTILVNTSRGGIIQSTDVISRGLRIGKLSFVALDVLPDEPPNAFDKLINEWRCRGESLQGRLIVNPHSAFYSEASWSEMRIKAAENVRRALSGRQPLNILN